VTLRFVSALAAVMALVFPDGALAIASSTTLSYTGAEQSYTVPSGVVMAALAVKGGRGGQDAEGGGHEGGVGALLPVVPGQQLFVEVGSAGVYAGGPVFGGGGAAGAPPPVLAMCNGSPCAQVYASSGGGASDVRTCSISASTCPGGVSSAATRVIVGGGGGGTNGSGNGPNVTCGALGGGGRANTFQYPPGNPSLGPVPIVAAAGIVYPGFDSASGGQVGPGVTPAGGGSDATGLGGSLAGCTNGSTGWADSIAGSTAVGPAGGTGGNASSLGPMYSGCVVSANNCFDAGAGGGGGGGYFGGGGGATGLDKETGSCGTCNAAGSGQGGGAGASFVSSQMMDPVDESLLLGAPANGAVVVYPEIEIDAPVNGAVYAPGQMVKSAWACGDASTIGLGIGSCTGTVATGAPINTSPGTHTFIVSGSVQSNGPKAVTATVTYTVKSGGAGGAGGHVAQVGLAGFKFTLSVPSACTARRGKLLVTVSKSGSGKGYRLRQLSYSIGHGKPSLVTGHTGAVHLKLGALAAGTHTLKLVITLASTKPHGKPKTKTLTLPFSVC
jgi:hypothetical protein